MRHLLSDTRGSTSAEYVTVLSLVAVGVVTAMALAGGLVLRLYLSQIRLLLLPFP
jgi:Flp pilus assembly pilin Flp